jgi:glycerol-3-phosphate dehydrogenase
LHSYRGNDPIGLELAGALKNVYAIASGMSEGLGFENNTRASQSLGFIGIRTGF